MELESVSPRQPIWSRAILVGGILGAAAGTIDGLRGFLYGTAGATAIAAVVLVVERAARRRFRLRPAGAPRLPAFGFVVWGFLFTCFAAVRFPELDGTWRIGVPAFVLAWWGVGILLARGARGALVPALALTALPWYVAAVRMVQRVEFVIREGGMEHRDGRGSPGIFLMVWLTELAFAFVPLTAIAAHVGWTLWRGRRGGARSEPSSDLGR